MGRAGIQPATFCLRDDHSQILIKVIIVGLLYLIMLRHCATSLRYVVALRRCATSLRYVVARHRFATSFRRYIVPTLRRCVTLLLTMHANVSGNWVDCTSHHTKYHWNISTCCWLQLLHVSATSHMRSCGGTLDTVRNVNGEDSCQLHSVQDHFHVKGSFTMSSWAAIQGNVRHWLFSLWSLSSVSNSVFSCLR